MTDHGPTIEIDCFNIREWKNYQVPRSMVNQDLLAAGWIPFWFGLCKQPINRCYKTGDLERFVFLSLMEYYEGKHINFFQLGAGLGNWCMALEGNLRFRCTPGPASYLALAVEAEPTHYQWAKECFEVNGVTGIVVHGAVCEEVGTRKFVTDTDPLTHYGQHIVEKDGDRTITVPSWTVDHLREKYGLNHIHIVQIDVQGSEALCVMGCKESLDLIDFFMIETHNTAVEERLKELLAHTHDLVIELPRYGHLELPGFSQPFRGIGGGLHLWKRSISA